MRFFKKLYRSFKHNSSTIVLVVLCGYYLARKYEVTNGIEIDFLGTSEKLIKTESNENQEDYDYAYDENIETKQFLDDLDEDEEEEEEDISDQARPDADYGLAVVYENVGSIVHGNSDVEKLDRFANLTKEQYK